MAKATIIRAEPVYRPVQTVRLDLTEQEARELQKFLWGGKWPAGEGPVVRGMAEHASGGSVLNSVHAALRRAFSDDNIPTYTGGS